MTSTTDSIVFAGKSSAPAQVSQNNSQAPNWTREKESKLVTKAINDQSKVYLKVDGSGIHCKKMAIEREKNKLEETKTGISVNEYKSTYEFHYCTPDRIYVHARQVDKELQGIPFKEYSKTLMALKHVLDTNVQEGGDNFSKELREYLARFKDQKSVLAQIRENKPEEKTAPEISKRAMSIIQTAYSLTNEELLVLKCILANLNGKESAKNEVDKEIHKHIAEDQDLQKHYKSMLVKLTEFSGIKSPKSQECLCGACSLRGPKIRIISESLSQNLLNPAVNAAQISRLKEFIHDTGKSNGLLAKRFSPKRRSDALKDVFAFDFDLESAMDFFVLAEEESSEENVNRVNWDKIENIGPIIVGNILNMKEEALIKNINMPEAQQTKIIAPTTVK